MTSPYPPTDTHVIYHNNIIAEIFVGEIFRQAQPRVLQKHFAKSLFFATTVQAGCILYVIINTGEEIH